MAAQQEVGVWVCCRCEPDAKLDENTIALMNKTCPIHGQAWHRKMVRDESGKLRLAMPICRSEIRC